MTAPTDHTDSNTESDQGGRRRLLGKNRPWYWPLLISIMIWLLIVPQLNGQDSDAEFARIDEITAQIDAGQVTQATMIDTLRRVEVTLADGRTLYSGYPRDYADDLLGALSAAGIGVEIEPDTPRNPLSDFIWSMLPLALIIGVMIFALRRFGGAGLRTQLASTKDQVSKIPDQRFSDVAGCDEAVEDLAEVVEFLKDPARYERLGARSPRGVLLIGPPGTGKTMLARATAGEAGVPFFALSGSDFVEMFVGVGASRVRTLFDKAKKAGRAIIFIDEIDAIGKKRGGGSQFVGGNDERESTLNALLVEMDGFEESGVVVLAATNRPDVLDGALLRPGRFDRRVVVGLPDRKGRATMFRGYLARSTTDTELDIDKVADSLASRSMGMSGADISAVVNEAALVAVRREGATGVNADDLNEALERVALGRERRSMQISDREREITAWHEAGHTVVALTTDGALFPERVSIVPRGQAGGATWFQGDDDQHFTTRTKATAELAVAFGGRAAEEVLLAGDFTQGATGDIAQATARAEKMVCEWGMSALGPIRIDLERSFDVDRQVRAEITDLLETAMTTARQALADNSDLLEAVAQALLERENLNADDLRELLAAHRTSDAAADTGGAS